MQGPIVDLKYYIFKDNEARLCPSAVIYGVKKNNTDAEVLSNISWGGM